MLNVVLFCPEIPPNTGNIGRLCHATGATLHLIEPLGFSVDDRAVRRAGLDYWQDLAPVIWPAYETFASALPVDASLYFLTTKTERVYWDATFRKGDYLIFGPETRGLPESLLKRNASRCLTIPQEAGRSLNLATSAGIVLYEAIRQVTKS